MSSDRLGIEGIRILAHHGYYAAEQKSGKEFKIDIYLSLDLHGSGKTDLLEDTVNYEKIIVLCQQEMAIPARLLEHVGYRIAHKIKAMGRFSQVTVRISKPQPLLPVQIERFFVEVNV